MGNGSGVSRGDRNRNARLERLRALVPVVNAIVGIDLADAKQMIVVTDHDSKVLARRTFRCRAWDLGEALDWAALQARARGFTGVTVACEPTGHRWRVLGQLAGVRGMPFVCVQPMLTSWARRSRRSCSLENVLGREKSTTVTWRRRRRTGSAVGEASVWVAALSLAAPAANSSSIRL